MAPVSHVSHLQGALGNPVCLTQGLPVCVRLRQGLSIETLTYLTRAPHPASSEVRTRSAPSRVGKSDNRGIAVPKTRPILRRAGPPLEALKVPLGIAPLGIARERCRILLRPKSFQIKLRRYISGCQCAGKFILNGHGCAFFAGIYNTCDCPCLLLLTISRGEWQAGTRQGRTADEHLADTSRTTIAEGWGSRPRPQPTRAKSREFSLRGTPHQNRSGLADLDRTPRPIFTSAN